MRKLLIAVLLIITSVLSARTKMKDDLPIWTPNAGPLTQLIATVPGSNIHETPAGQYTLPYTVTIHKAIQASSNLSSLSLRLALLGCSSWPDRWNLPFALEGGDKYPLIKHVCLERYDFDENEYEKVSPPKGIPLRDSPFYQWDIWLTNWKPWRWLWLRQTVPRQQLVKTNAELWADAMDWSSVQSLDFRDLQGSGFIKHIGHRLTSLTEIRLDWFDSCNTTEWLVSLPPLTSLTWLGGSDTREASLTSLLERHGPTLKTLALHYLRTTWEGPFITTQQIQQISKSAPNLTNLAIALHRNGTWPLEALSAIASMPELESVELWLEYVNQLGFQQKHYHPDDDYDYEMYEMDNMPENKPDRHEHTPEGSKFYQKPLVDEDGVTEIWEYMQTASNGRLKKVSFHAGNFMRHHDGPVYMPEWTDRRRILWVCDSEGCRESEREPDVFERKSEEDWRADARRRGITAYDDDDVDADVDVDVDVDVEHQDADPEAVADTDVADGYPENYFDV